MDVPFARRDDVQPDPDADAQPETPNGRFHTNSLSNAGPTVPVRFVRTDHQEHAAEGRSSSGWSSRPPRRSVSQSLAQRNRWGTTTPPSGRRFAARGRQVTLLPD